MVAYLTAHPGPCNTAKGGACSACFFFRHSALVRGRWGGDPALAEPPPAKPRPAKARRVRRSLPVACPYEGEIVRRCNKCGDAGEQRHVRQCLHPENTSGLTTRGDNDGTGGMWSCHGCDERPANAHPPTRRFRVAGLAGHFNGSLIEYDGRLLLASRMVGRLYLSELDDRFRAVRTAKLDIDLPGNHEDPRLFLWRGKLMVSFAVATAAGRRVQVRQAVAEVDPAGAVRDARVVGFARGPMEKNWTPFEGPTGDLLAVYSVAPRHVVLRIDGDRAEVVADAPNPFPWAGGHARGGSPPVLVGSEYVGWFHGQVQAGNRRVYSVGRYTFAADTLAVTGQSPIPLLWAGRHHPDRSDELVVFPAGAVLREGGWLVSCGVADRFVEVMEWPAG